MLPFGKERKKEEEEHPWMSGDELDQVVEDHEEGPDEIEMEGKRRALKGIRDWAKGKEQEHGRGIIVEIEMEPHDKDEEDEEKKKQE